MYIPSFEVFQEYHILQVIVEITMWMEPTIKTYIRSYEEKSLEGLGWGFQQVLQNIWAKPN